MYREVHVDSELVGNAAMASAAGFNGMDSPSSCGIVCARLEVCFHQPLKKGNPDENYARGYRFGQAGVSGPRG